MAALSMSPKQAHYYQNSKSRINLCVGAIRSSKTWAQNLRFVRYVCKEAPSGDLLMIGRTHRSLYRNVIRPMQEVFGSHRIQYKVSKGEVSIFGRTVFIVGASDERAEGVVRGMTCAGCLGDEVTLWPESLFMQTLGRMSPPGSKFFGTTNTDSPFHWLKKKVIDRAGDIDVATFTFLLSDNPYLDPLYVQSITNEYTGLWRRRFILGEWCVAEGAIYEFYDEDEHVWSSFPTPQFYAVGVDYGTGNPTVFIKYGVNMIGKPRIWAEDEWYYDSSHEHVQLTDGEYADEMKAWLGNCNPRVIVVDPSAASFKIQLSRIGFGQVQDADNSVIDGIRTVARMLKSGDYVVGDKCQNLRRERPGYSWDMKKQLLGIDAPRKIEDHAMDTERYVLHTLFGDSNTLDYSLLTKS